MEDMAALGVREPDVLTRVTEYVQQIQVHNNFSIVVRAHSFPCLGIHPENC